MRLDDLWRDAMRRRQELRFTLAEQLHYLPRVPTRVLRQALVHYRYLTESLVDDMAFLAARCPPGRLKTLLASQVADALGNGNPERAHLALYTRFLASIGALQGESAAAPSVSGILMETRKQTLTRPLPYAIGLRGLGGIGVGGVYYQTLYQYLRRHPFVEAHADRIDWGFWAIYGGCVSEERDARVRAAVDELMAEHPEQCLGIPDLAAGYRFGAAVWQRVWKYAYADHVRQVSGPASNTHDRRGCLRSPVTYRGTARMEMQSIGVWTIDVSESGLLLSTTSPLEGNLLLTLSVKGSRDVQLECTTHRHSRTTKAGYRAGVRVVDVLQGQETWANISHNAGVGLKPVESSKEESTEASDESAAEPVAIRSVPATA